MNEPETPVRPAKPRFRGVSHQIAAFASLVLGLVLFALASTTSVRWAVLVYTLGLTAMYTTSALYHRGHWSDATRLRLRRPVLGLGGAAIEVSGRRGVAAEEPGRGPVLVLG